MLLSVMLLRQPRYTLFPYTTLFRSRTPTRVLERAGPAGYRAVMAAECTHLDQVRVSEMGALGGHDRTIPDRKSTRLNSSHVEISYAVFCLKKKKVIMRPIGVTSQVN